MSKSPLIILHLAGLMLAVGSVLILDLRLASLFFGKKISQIDAVLVYILSPFARIGLAMLWISGLSFLVHYYIYDPHLLANPKLHAKIVVVSILTLNGVFIEKYAVPHIINNRGAPLFEGLTHVQSINMLIAASVSAVSWYVPVAFGAVRELNFWFSAEMLLGMYGMLIILATSTMFGLKAVLYDPSQGAATNSDVSRKRAFNVLLSWVSRRLAVRLEQA